MKALIFGIGGFVGRYVTDELISRGYEVAGSDIMLSCDLPQVEYYNGDLLNADFVASLVEKVRPDAIINLAAISSVGASWKIPQTTIQVNVVGALNILEAAGKYARDAKILFIGSSEEYCIKEGMINESDPLSANNPYGISKMAQEQFVECYRSRYGLKIYYVRPFNHTGIGQRDSFVLPSFCKQAADLEAAGVPGEIHVGNLSAKRDFSDVRDIARAYCMILESEDDRIVYNVGSGKAYGLDEMLQYIVSLCTVEVKIVIDQDRFRPIDTPIVLCDNSLIRQKLGWEPEYSIFDTLKEMYEYYLKNEQA
ncbi:MAG: GDP-mannose 4,6-dehydratase [Clostridiales bacterium]|nr:GDP-mannose 4,6-dehydratase [Clostridiales bacterium]